jgi:hypothetical protein
MFYVVLAKEENCITKKGNRLEAGREGEMFTTSENSLLCFAFSPTYINTPSFNCSFHLAPKSVASLRSCALQMEKLWHSEQGEFRLNLHFMLRLPERIP